MEEKQLIEKWRGEFEQLKINSCILADNAKKPDGCYINFHTENQWKGFLMAKRNMPVVEIPRGFYDDDDIVLAIKSAGIQYRIKG